MVQLSSHIFPYIDHNLAPYSLLGCHRCLIIRAIVLLSPFEQAGDEGDSKGVKICTILYYPFIKPWKCTDTFFPL